MAVASPYPALAIPDHLSLPEFLLARLAHHGDAVALLEHTGARPLTYRQVGSQAAALAGALQRRGLRPRDTVAAFLPNIPEFPVLMLGVALAGGVLTTTNPSYTPKELGFQLRDSDAQYVVTVPELLPVLRATGCPLREVFVVGPPAPGGGGGATLFADLLQPGPLHTPVPVRPAADVVVLPYSSGTTSLPKGVRLTHRNLIANILQTSHPAHCCIGFGDTILGLLPFFHIYGMVTVLLGGLYLGARIVTVPKFEKDAFLRALAAHRVTHLHVAPPIVLMLAKNPEVAAHDLSALRDIMSGAAPLGQELAEGCARRLGCSMRQGYGMTEMSPVSHVLPFGSTKYSSIGRLVPNMEMKIVEVATGRPVAPGAHGELLLRGPNVMLGYHNNAAATAETLDAEGWLHTGDVGYQDGDGDCFIVDRCKELIKVKGFQVAPAELEDVLQGHPAVADCAVVGITVGMDEAPRAFVILRDGHPPSDALRGQIIEFAARVTAPYKRLRDVIFVAAIPKTASGKILRRELRAAHAATPAKL